MLFSHGIGLGAFTFSSALEVAQYYLNQRSWVDISGHTMTNHIEETAGIWGDYLLEHFSHVLKHVLQAMFPTGYHFI